MIFASYAWWVLLEESATCNVSHIKSFWEPFHSTLVCYHYWCLIMQRMIFGTSVIIMIMSISKTTTYSVGHESTHFRYACHHSEEAKLLQSLHAKCFILQPSGHWIEFEPKGNLKSTNKQTTVTLSACDSGPVTRSYSIRPVLIANWPVGTVLAAQPRAGGGCPREGAFGSLGSHPPGPRITTWSTQLQTYSVLLIQLST